MTGGAFLKSTYYVTDQIINQQVNSQQTGSMSSDTAETGIPRLTQTVCPSLSAFVVLLLRVKARGGTLRSTASASFAPIEVSEFISHHALSGGAFVQLREIWFCAMLVLHVF